MGQSRILTPQDYEVIPEFHTLFQEMLHTLDTYLDERKLQEYMRHCSAEFFFINLDPDSQRNLYAHFTDATLDGLAIEQRAPGKSYGYIEWLYAAARQQGIGSSLLECVEENGKQDGLSGIRLKVAKENTFAKAFYEKTGFKEYVPLRERPLPGMVYFVQHFAT